MAHQCAAEVARNYDRPRIDGRWSPDHGCRVMKETDFEGVGGLRIYTRFWRPTEPARAAVVIVHGFNAHSGHYAWVGEQFASKGIAAYALDLRGRGRSDGERYYVEKFQDYVDDVAQFVS